MRPIIMTALFSGLFTTYTGPEFPDQRIEAITDRGPILEMIIRCRTGTAIISYSKIDKLFCDPRLICSASKDNVINKTCG